MPTPSAITGSVATLTPMPSDDHQRLAQDRRDHQRHDRHHHRAPAAEGDEAQHDHRRVDVEQHLRFGLARRRCWSPPRCRRCRRRAGTGDRLSSCLRANAGGGIDDAVERLGLVVGEVGDHRHHRAVGVEQVGVVDRGLLRGVVQHVLVAVDRQPLRVALERAGGDLAHRVGAATPSSARRAPAAAPRPGGRPRPASGT